MALSLAFYRELLGFEIVEQAPSGEQPDWVWLRRGVIEIMLNTMFEQGFRPPEPDLVRNLGHGDCTLFLGTPDVQAMFLYLKSKGLELKPPVVQSYGMKQLNLKDPDGYGICFQWPAS